MLSIHLPSYITVYALSYSVIIINQSIHQFILIFKQALKILQALISLSTLVLNSRDWSEIVWLPEISRFKINLAISFIRKLPTGMHWLGYNDAVPSLNEAKNSNISAYSQF